MAGKVLNIEIGEGVCKVCCAAPSKKGCHITDSFMFRTPEDCVTDGSINNADALADKLKLELEARHLRTVKSAVFSVASGKIASREVRLPQMKDKQLAQTVKTNAADYFPVDVTKYHVTHLLLERVKGKDGFCRVLVLAVPLSLLEGYFKLAELAKLDIKAIDSCSNSHYQAIRKLKEPKVCMYVDVECMGSFVSFIQGDDLLLQRTFAFGGGDLISSYMSNAGYGEDEYVRAIGEVSEGHDTFVGNDAVGDTIIQDDLSRLVYSIVRSVDYFNSFRSESGTQQIVLMGACGHVAGLKEQVAAATDLPTVYLEEISGAQALCQGADASVFISCIGCNILPVDFMPEFLKRRGKNIKRASEETIVKGIIGGGVLILGAIALAALSILSYKQAEAELLRTQNEIASLESAEQVFLTYNAYEQGEQAMLQVRTLAENPNTGLVAFFEELEQKMPSEIMVLSAVCTTDGISMNITVPGLEEAAVVLSQLRSFETLSAVEVSGIVTQSDEAGFKTASFTLDCKYGVNPYLNDINPYGDLFTEENPEGEQSAVIEDTSGTEVQQ